jgi:hypothetical protein
LNNTVQICAVTECAAHAAFGHDTALATARAVHVLRAHDSVAHCLPLLQTALLLEHAVGAQCVHAAASSSAAVAAAVTVTWWQAAFAAAAAASAVHVDCATAAGAL